MASLLYQTIDQLSREKGIDLQIIVSAVEDAMLVATRKYYKSGEDLKAEFNKETGQVEVYAVKKVVETVTNPLKEISLDEGRTINPQVELDGEVRIQKPTDVLGRIAAQTAKQVIYQKVREAERDTVYNEYSGRVGEVVNCAVKRLEGPDLIVEIGKAEARLPRREQSRLEQFSMGDRLRAVIIKVEKSVKGPQVIVSRAAPELVLRLFEQEVPEIYDGTVAIKGCAREAGERTKIAVLSRDRDVDSVGACVGMKGMRVESIRRELRGEKIDIVEHSEDPVVFATHALSPAKISRVAIVDPAEKHLEVIVDDTQLSLAIGKKGQNVRLAAKLLGWRIDIKSEEEKRQEVEWQMGQLVGSGTPLSQLTTLSERLQEKLLQHDISTIERLGARTPEELQEIPGIGPKMVEKIRAAVQNYWEGTGEGTEGAAGVETAEAEPEAEAGVAAMASDAELAKGAEVAPAGTGTDVESEAAEASEGAHGAAEATQEPAPAGAAEATNAAPSARKEFTGENAGLLVGQPAEQLTEVEGEPTERGPVAAVSPNLEEAKEAPASGTDSEPMRQSLEPAPGNQDRRAGEPKQAQSAPSPEEGSTDEVKNE